MIGTYPKNANSTILRRFRYSLKASVCAIIPCLSVFGFSTTPTKTGAAYHCRQLGETLSQLEQWAGSADDPTLRELKPSILRTIAEHELRNEERAAAKAQKGTTTAITTPENMDASLR
jgi:hypothetical protein